MSRAPIFLAIPIFFTLSSGAPAPPVISPTQELVLGEEALVRFLATRKETEDAELAARVDALNRRLAAVSDRPDVLHRVVVVEADDLQAFAFLGGTVAATEALARSLDDDELAFALAHEMAHVDLRHRTDREVAEDVVREAAGSGPSAGAALGVHARHAELEADRFGALYLVRAGFRFSAAFASLQKLAEGEREEDAGHPPYEERIVALRRFETELRRALEAFDRGCAALQAGRSAEAVDLLTLFVASFPQSLAGQVDLGAAYLARWRAASGTPDGLEEVLPTLPEPGIAVRSGFPERDGRNARRHFEAALRLDPGTAVARAGLALVLLRDGRTAEAQNLLRGLEEDPRLRPEALLLLGNTAFLQGAWEHAARYYEEALRVRPGWSAASKNLARALERKRDTAATVDVAGAR